MIISRSIADAVFSELCKTGPAQSVFVVPPDSDLRQRVCAADRRELMAFAEDLYQRINMSTVRKEVSELLVFCRLQYNCEELVSSITRRLRCQVD